MVAVLTYFFSPFVFAVVGLTTLSYLCCWDVFLAAPATGRSFGLTSVLTSLVIFPTTSLLFLLGETPAFLVIVGPWLFEKNDPY